MNDQNDYNSPSAEENRYDTRVDPNNEHESSVPIKLGENTPIKGRYKLIKQLGRGGMGEVWLAEDENLNKKKVAIKFLTFWGPIDQQEEYQRRFKREGNIMSLLAGAHLVRVTDQGQLDDGQPFIVMDYLRGCSLDEKLKKDGPMPAREVANIVLDITKALVDAHALNIVHRDLKPANVFLEVSPAGTTQVKVLDFGIAKILEEDDDAGPRTAKMTGTGMVIGTAPYMAPEQFEAGSIGPKCDVYALGVLAYECLTGKVPFEGDHLAIMRAHVKDLAPPPFDEKLEVPKSFKNFVFALLQRNINLRPSPIEVLNSPALAPEFNTTRSKPRWGLRVGAALAISISSILGVQLLSFNNSTPNPPQEFVSLDGSLSFNEVKQVYELVRASRTTEAKTIVENALDNNPTADLHAASVLLSIGCESILQAEQKRSEYCKNQRCPELSQITKVLSRCYGSLSLSIKPSNTDITFSGNSRFIDTDYVVTQLKAGQEVRLPAGSYNIFGASSDTNCKPRQLRLEVKAKQSQKLELNLDCETTMDVPSGFIDLSQSLDEKKLTALYQAYKKNQFSKCRSILDTAISSKPTEELLSARIILASSCSDTLRTEEHRLKHCADKNCINLAQVESIVHDCYGTLKISIKPADAQVKLSTKSKLVDAALATAKLQSNGRIRLPAGRYTLFASNSCTSKKKPVVVSAQSTALVRLMLTCGDAPKPKIPSYETKMILEKSARIKSALERIKRSCASKDTGQNVAFNLYLSPARINSQAPTPYMRCILNEWKRASITASIGSFVTFRPK